jgi:hypothetical protein
MLGHSVHNLPQLLFRLSWLLVKVDNKILITVLTRLLDWQQVCDTFFVLAECSEQVICRFVSNSCNSVVHVVDDRLRGIPRELIMEMCQDLDRFLNLLRVIFACWQCFADQEHLAYIELTLALLDYISAVTTKLTQLQKARKC